MFKADFSNKDRLELSGQNLQVLPRLDSSTECLIADNNSITSLTNLSDSLKLLSLARNKIAFLGNLDSQVPLLQSLNLSFNRLISLEGISNCIHLQELRLSNNYVGDDQILMLQNLVNLRILDISHNHLRDSAFLRVLQRLENLEELWNSANDFSEWVMPFKMNSLKKLILDANKIRTLEFKEDMPEMQVLSCKENNLVGVNGIKHCRGLVEVDLTGNDISELDDEWTALKILRVLIVKNNSIAELPYFQNLEVVDASHNCLVNISVLSKKIKELYVNNNSILEIPPLPNLICADFSYNKLTSVSNISGAYSLQMLNISYNLFSNSGGLFKQLQNLVNLVSLDIRGVDLSESSQSTFLKHFISLESFNGDNLVPEDTSRKHKTSLRASPAWDYLSKSKLFPSCRSSIGDNEKNPKNPLHEFSMFSDIKPGNSLTSSISSHVKQKELQEEAHKDFEFDLLAKELEINQRISKLDFKTRHLGDSLISRKTVEGNENLANSRKTDYERIAEKGSLQFNDSLISKKETDITTYEDLPNPSFYRLKPSEASDFRVPQKVNIARQHEKNVNSSKTPLRIPSMVNSQKLDLSSELDSIPRAYIPAASNHKSELEVRRNSRNQAEEKFFEKDDTTLSFEISNDVSREKPPREPLKTIHEGSQSKKSKCCRHCCRKRRKSVNLQTTIKDSGDYVKSVPKFIDQATSPINSAFNTGSLNSLNSKNPQIAKSQKQVLEFKTFIDSFPKPSHSNGTFATDQPISSQRNRSLLTETEEKELSRPESRTSKRSSTPFLSHRYASNKPKESDLVQLINYACTPPRPILSSEANSALICTLSTKGTEFFLISQIFQKEQRLIKEVKKTYTYSLQKRMKISRPETFLHKNGEGDNALMFYSSNRKELESICSSPEGFSAVYKGNPSELVLTMDVSALLSSYKGSRVVLIALVNMKNTTKIKENTFQMNSLQNVIPVYMIEC